MTILTSHEPPPPEEYRETLYSESVQLKEQVLDLLAQTRAHRVRFRFWRGQVAQFEDRYNRLFGAFIDYDKHVSSFTDTTTNPWAKHLEALSNWDRSSILNQTDISSRILFAQWESVRTLFQDVNSQITDLNNQINNNVIFLIAIVSICIALLSLLVALFSSAEVVLIPPLTNR
jgi:hypothetical protein